MSAAGSFFRKSFLAATLVAAAGFFVLGYGALKLTPEGNSIAIIWPADAFALCLMVRYARGWRERIARRRMTVMGSAPRSGGGIRQLPR